MTSTGPPIYPGASTFPGMEPAPPGDGSTPTTPAVVEWSTPGGELTVRFDTTSTPPRVELRVFWPGASTVTLVRTDPNNDRWPVRFTEPAILDGSGSWSGYDYEVPYGAAITYTLASAQKSAPLTLLTGVFDVPKAWRVALIHPQAPLLSVPIRLARESTATVENAVRQVVLQPMGRRRPIVVSDIRQAGTSQLMVRTKTSQQRAALDGLLADGAALRLACDPRIGLDIPQGYIAIGTQTTARLSGSHGLMEDRVITLPYTEVDRPAGVFRGIDDGDGGNSGYWSYGAAEAAYPTYAAAEAAYATYGDAALDRRR